MAGTFGDTDVLERYTHEIETHASPDVRDLALLQAVDPPWCGLRRAMCAAEARDCIITCESHLTCENSDDYAWCCLSYLNHVGSRMVPLLPWIERQWSFTASVGTFPAVLERLVGTPARAATLVARVPETVLEKRTNGKWSVKEHFGHLCDLHALDMRRVDEFLAGAAVLSAADMTNRRTDEANHGAMSIAPLLQALHEQRQRLILRLENLTGAEIGATAVHPRLGVKVRLIDWAQFVADHDDHHLAAARMVLCGVKTVTTT